MLLFFRNTLNTGTRSNEINDMNLLRLCDTHNIPVATNIATAEVLIHGLERGDLEWRNIIKLWFIKFNIIIELNKVNK